MSTWRYCENCDSPMNMPSFGEIIVDVEICKACGHLNPGLTDSEERITLLNTLWDKVNKPLP